MVEDPHVTPGVVQNSCFRTINMCKPSSGNFDRSTSLLVSLVSTLYSAYNALNTLYCGWEHVYRHGWPHEWDYKFLSLPLLPEMMNRMIPYNWICLHSYVNFTPAFKFKASNSTFSQTTTSVKPPLSAYFLPDQWNTCSKWIKILVPTKFSPPQPLPNPSFSSFLDYSRLQPNDSLRLRPNVFDGETVRTDYGTSVTHCPLPIAVNFGRLSLAESLHVLLEVSVIFWSNLALDFVTSSHWLQKMPVRYW